MVEYFWCFRLAVGRDFAIFELSDLRWVGVHIFHEVLMPGSRLPSRPGFFCAQRPGSYRSGCGSPLVRVVVISSTLNMYTRSCFVKQS